VGACTGLQKPLTELCNGRDDDCDGSVDNGGMTKDDWADPTNPNYGTAHPCCSTGNLADCMNTGTGMRCQVGGYVCLNGQKVCMGSVAKSIEICDMVDNDCNGPVDDVPGLNSPCTGNGVETRGECTARLECVAGNTVPQCVQKQGPVAELCNSKDDNCNGKIDDTDPPLAPAGGKLPGEGVACDIPVPPADKLPCKPGATVCVAGNLVCQGAVGPMPNQCNGVSTDCTGMPNTNGNCPTGFQCYQGNCVAPCQSGEFPCPGGYACQSSTMLCIPDECAKITCPKGFNCSLDAAGMASCTDPCDNVSCPTGYLCKVGVCVDASCRTQGCPSGEVCVATGTNMFDCQPDPCADVICPDGQFCAGGGCVAACAGPCPKGQFCDKGQCAPEPCATPCIAGQVCSVVDGAPVCVDNQCQFGCGFGQACCGGSCVADQCEHLHCPEDTHCTLTTACNATCETNPQSPKDQIVGAGGGGFGCSVGGHESAPSLAWLFLVGGALLLRRRRAGEVRR
jgi:MYXO-CTERM domain-containing protein